MATNNKKIYLLVASQPFGLQPKDWLEHMPELSIISEIEPIFIFKQAGADVTPEIWFKLAEEIYDRLDQAAGFVVLHGVDNILYTSSAIAFLLQNLNKPIIFTGSQSTKPETKRLEIRANLINSVQTANYGLNEVCLMFGNRLLRAVSATRTNDESLNVFSGPLSATLGRIDFSIRIFEKAGGQAKSKTKFYHRLSDKVEIIDLLPTLNLKSLTRRVADKEGIIVNAGIFQTLPVDLVFLLEKVTADIPVIIWSKNISNPVLAPKNILLINNLTWETTVTKFMWALAESKNIAKIKELMAKDIVGEIID
ncbi:MAG: asparaginase domain-containing protein [Patescibacteria group bacterium]|jgi:L-asparaginase/Glu-tRNA(Gln) amidotransferase subunit D